MSRFKTEVESTVATDKSSDILQWNMLASYAASAVRFGSGMRVKEVGVRPGLPLELYEYEACPDCRKVREALSILDLDAMILPCPKAGTRFRAEAMQRGGIAQFPFLVDPNHGVAMHEPADIVRHLFRAYGTGRVPAPLRWGTFSTWTSSLASVARLPASGLRARASRAPELPLELYSYEASAHCRIVREELCSLELRYLLHNAAKGSRGRRALEAKTGKAEIPFLVDPNTGTELFDARVIVSYLRDTYGA